MSKIHTFKGNKSEAWRGSNFLATAVQHLPMCVCVCSSHYGLGWHHYIRQVHQPHRTSNFFFLVALEGWCTRRQAVCVRMLSAAPAVVLYSVCKYVNISTTAVQNLRNKKFNQNTHTSKYMFRVLLYNTAAIAADSLRTHTAPLASPVAFDRG